jgi:hypothetical protein
MDVASSPILPALLNHATDLRNPRLSTTQAPQVSRPSFEGKDVNKIPHGTKTRQLRQEMALIIKTRQESSNNAPVWKDLRLRITSRTISASP